MIFSRLFGSVHENRPGCTWSCFAGARSGAPTLSISPIRQPLDFDADFDGSSAQLRSGLEHTARYASGCGRTQRDTSAQQTESQRSSYKQNVVPSHTDPNFSTQTLFIRVANRFFIVHFLDAMTMTESRETRSLGWHNTSPQ